MQVKSKILTKGATRAAGRRSAKTPTAICHCQSLLPQCNTTVIWAHASGAASLQSPQSASLLQCVCLPSDLTIYIYIYKYVYAYVWACRPFGRACLSRVCSLCCRLASVSPYLGLSLPVPRYCRWSRAVSVCLCSVCALALAFFLQLFCFHEWGLRIKVFGWILFDCYVLIYLGLRF